MTILLPYCTITAMFYYSVTYTHIIISYLMQCPMIMPAVRSSGSYGRTDLCWCGCCAPTGHTHPPVSHVVGLMGLVVVVVVALAGASMGATDGRQLVRCWPDCHSKGGEVPDGPVRACALASPDRRVPRTR